MSSFPQLDENSKRVLRILVSRSVVSGRDLLKISELQPTVLSNTLRLLVNEKLIDASSFDFNPQNLVDTFFNVLPSSIGLAKLAAS
jgi:hypothetical protein